MKIQMSYELAMAISRDAGNASMRRAGRAKWNRADWNASCNGFKQAAKAMLPDVRRRYFTDEEMA